MSIDKHTAERIAWHLSRLTPRAHDEQLEVFALISLLAPS